MAGHRKRQEDILYAAATSIAFVAIPLIYFRICDYYYSRDNNKSPLAVAISKQSTKIKPPFPHPVRDMLSKCNLAYLSTIDATSTDPNLNPNNSSELSSHLSLMRFTYINDADDGEVVIMSTNMETKKYEMLQRQKGVALLVHDFSSRSEGGGGGKYSITLNGDCRIVKDPVKSGKYRQAHLQNNPDYPQFIVGDKIAILCVDVKSARICNIHDRVVKWDVNNNDDNSISSSYTEEANIAEDALDTKETKHSAAIR
eukprot:scaffold3437_cov113-Cylindrotheca_fusiformis.AAC.48